MAIDNVNIIDGMGIIEIHFKYEISQNCERFLNTVQSQVAQYGIKIEVHIG